MPSPHLVLASSSPRRKELLGRLALEFTIEAADIDESTRPGEPAEVYVERLALEKAAIVARPGTVVVAADTAVVLDGTILGKPRDRADAVATLARLSGRAHVVVTGVCVHHQRTGESADISSAVEESKVHVDTIDTTRIAWYVATGEADDKAGSYGLQGAAGLFADRVEGSTSNVIGLPLPLLGRLFAEVALDVLDFRAVVR